MITKIIDALNAFDYYGETENIEIAKGKYELATDFTKAKERLKRLRHDRKGNKNNR